MRELVREGAYLAANATLYAGLYPALRTARVRWVEPLDELEALVRARRVIFCAWHRYGYAVYFVFGRHVPPALRVRVLGHDGPLSRIATRAGEWVGYPCLQYERRGARSPREQIVDALRADPRPLLVMTDSGGPYFRVKPGLIDIAQAVEASVVPIALAQRGCLVVGGTLRHVVPLAGCRLEVLRGPTLSGAALSAHALQQELEALEQRVAAHAPGR